MLFTSKQQTIIALLPPGLNRCCHPAAGDLWSLQPSATLPPSANYRFSRDRDPVAPRQSSAEPVLDWEGLCHLSCAPFTVLREKNQLSTSPKCVFSAVGLSLETKRTDKQSIYNLQHQHHFMLLFFHLKLSFLSIK